MARAPSKYSQLPLITLYRIVPFESSKAVVTALFPIGDIILQYNHLTGDHTGYANSIHFIMASMHRVKQFIRIISTNLYNSSVRYVKLPIST